MPDRTSVSNAGSYQEIGAYWDRHDATEYGEQEPVEFDVHIRSQRHYFPIESQICRKIKQLADHRGVSEETLLNIFLKERIDQLEREQESLTTKST
ncbi:MAG: CopG family antitoxin [Candidatus Competibacteraceae bacterium]|nr:CopG family antitoxin [Candidatus Competibacteraceae bacterium]